MFVFAESLFSCALFAFTTGHKYKHRLYTNISTKWFLYLGIQCYLPRFFLL